MKVKVFRRSENEWVDVFGKMQIHRRTDEQDACRRSHHFGM